jgi:hypothetical protein
MSNHWVFQCNPRFFRIFDALKDGVAEITWPIKQNKGKIGRGDEVILWASSAGKSEAGAIARGRIVNLTPNRTAKDDSSYWVVTPGAASAWATVVIKTPLPTKPVLRSYVMGDATLREMTIARLPRGTNFAITSEQWKRLVGLLDG